MFVVAGYVRSFETGRVDHGRAMALAVLTFSSATLPDALSRLRTATAGLTVIASIALSLVLTQVQPLAPALHLEPLDPDDWAIATAASPFVGALPLVFDYALSTKSRQES